MARRRQSVHAHSFSHVPAAEIQRSRFDRSHGYKTTFDAGRLIPFFVDEALPGDTLNLRASGFARMTTPIFPIMDNLFLDTHWFSIPVRQIWNNWIYFMGEVEDPQAPPPPDFLVPEVSLGATQLTAGSIGDYMGLPIGKDNLKVSALFHRAYRWVWNEWFRDQNLQNPLPLDKGDGPDGPVDTYETLCAVRGKRHDYFTSCLPFAQKGPDVTIGLAGFAPVVGDVSGDQQPTFDLLRQGAPVDAKIGLQSGAGDSVRFNGFTTSYAFDELTWNDPKLVADLTGGSAVTINALREAFQVQKFYERDARSGTRYPEMIMAHFRVQDPSYLVLQRPEYLGGGTTPVNINPMFSTSDTTTTAGSDGRPLGGLSAVVTASFQGHGFTKSFTEHCIVLGLVSVRADLTYQQGIPRMFSRKEKFDFYFPVFAHLGEQEVLNKEIWYSNDPAVDEQAFGYQERYAEYRYKPSLITGKFRSDDPQSLDAWHLSEDFAALPTLNETFIRHQPPIDRVVAVPDEPDFIADFWFDYKCARPMPVNGVPGNVDRF